MLTPEQAALLIIVDPSFKPGTTMQGALQLAGFTDENDRLTKDAVRKLVPRIRETLEAVAVDVVFRTDCESHDIPIEGCC